MVLLLNWSKSNRRCSTNTRTITSWAMLYISTMMPWLIWEGWVLRRIWLMFFVVMWVMMVIIRWWGLGQSCYLTLCYICNSTLIVNVRRWYIRFDRLIMIVLTTCLGCALTSCRKLREWWGIRCSLSSIFGPIYRSG